MDSYDEGWEDWFDGLQPQSDDPEYLRGWNDADNSCEEWPG